MLLELVGVRGLDLSPAGAGDGGGGALLGVSKNQGP